MIENSTAVQSVRRLVEGFVADHDEVRAAICTAGDARLVARSANLDVAGAERLARMTAGLLSLAVSTSRMFGGGRLEGLTIRLGHAHLLVHPLGGGGCVTVLVAPTAEPGAVADALDVLGRECSREMGWFVEAR